MNKSNALNCLTSIPTTTTTTTRSSNFALEIFVQNDKQIQCTLIEPPLYLELRSFSIEDENKRKLLVQNIFGWIILQNFIYLFVMYSCLQYESIIPDKYGKEFLEIVLAIDLICSVLFYCFRNLRRRVPYLSLIMVTVLNAVLIGIYANFMNNLMILMQPTILILQLLAIILFSLQTKLEFTYFKAFGIILSVLISAISLEFFVFKTNSGELFFAYTIGSLTAVYITFDLQLMMTSPLHKYCMAENEHVFGAVNIFADQTKLGWLMFRSIFLDGPITVCRTILKTLSFKLY